ncbi:unnamed protein product [Didymodactylos carnosus]|uniref:F-box domain-containing protein n=2 Tax=Didymodactylos carnosus TaxID=1234261 RepID=A0A8S2UNL0_9BILA|nr:unnamed protein product [Didymodactylos carnosus]CAF4354232.1 unnamed protein product [Didymodactylos carnosus]
MFLDDLSDDVLMLIFEKLDIIVLHAAVKNVNHRFNRILTDKRLRFYSNTSAITQDKLEYYRRNSLTTMITDFSHNNTVKFNLQYLFNSKMTKIERLTLQICVIQDLIDILPYLPELQYLNIKDLNMDYLKYTDDALHNISLMRLTCLILNITPLQFSTLKKFLECMPILRKLTISGQCFPPCDECFDTEQWKRLSSTSLPKLEHFHLALRARYTPQLDELKKTFEKDEYWTTIIRKSKIILYLRKNPS